MSPEEAEGFLREQFVGRVGCHSRGRTYVVPVIYIWHEGCAYVYSVEGQKVEMMRENPSVCFEVDQYNRGGGWKSVIVQGTYEELGGEGAALALRLLTERFSRPAPDGGEPVQRPRGEGRAPVAFRIRAGDVTGRKVDYSPTLSSYSRPVSKNAST
jgi:nitroimidazol reductase NimA-like FMN-containing flavoprotein (pyridoxamine 5'-phosphate oxidase superfamily)